MWPVICFSLLNLGLGFALAWLLQCRARRFQRLLDLGYDFHTLAPPVNQSLGRCRPPQSAAAIAASICRRLEQNTKFAHTRSPLTKAEPQPIEGPEADRRFHQPASEQLATRESQPDVLQQAMSKLQAANHQWSAFESRIAEALHHPDQPLIGPEQLAQVDDDLTAIRTCLGECQNALQQAGAADPSQRQASCEVTHRFRPQPIEQQKNSKPQQESRVFYRENDDANMFVLETLQPQSHDSTIQPDARPRSNPSMPSSADHTPL